MVNTGLNGVEYAGNFLEAVAKVFIERAADEEGGLGKYTFVFPNRRSSKFFQRHLGIEYGRKYSKPLFSPSCTTISELFTSLSGYEEADPLESLYLLYTCYIKLKYPDKSLQEAQKIEPFDEFYNWGAMIIKDFNDIDTYLVFPEQIFTNIRDLKELEDDFSYMSEGQRRAVNLFWTNFLSGGKSEVGGGKKEAFISLWVIMSQLYREFQSLLDGRGRGYSGMIYRSVAERLSKEGYSKTVEGRLEQIVFIGFNAPNKCEQTLMREAQKEGMADFYWDYYGDAVTDPDNKASLFISDFVREFPSRYEIGGEASKTFANKNYHAIGVSSGVGQALVLNKILGDLYKEQLKVDCNSEFTRASESANSAEKENLTDAKIDSLAFSTAVVLPDEQMLMPVINSIPSCFKKINVTMGYPMKTTALFSFLNLIYDLQREVKQGTLFYHRSISSLLEHEYITILAADESKSIIHKIVMTNMIYVAVDDPLIAGMESPLLKKLFLATKTQEELYSYLKEIITLLETSLPVREREFIYRYYQLINRLSQLKLPFSMAVCFKILSAAAAQTTIPFNGEPLAGLQIMGPLETRSLDFENIIILSANEGVFPASNSSQSLIPYNLRYGFGLPNYEMADTIGAYHFYRSIYRAKNIYMIYDTRSEGVKCGEMSRYIMQLKYHYKVGLVEEEAVFPLQGGVLSSETSVVKDEEVMSLLKRKYSTAEGKEGSLSVTALNTYIDCPLKFYLTYLLGIKREEEVKESVEADTFGNLFHKVMQKAYFKYEGKLVTKSDIEKIATHSSLQSLLEKEFKEMMNIVEISGQNIIVMEVLKRYLAWTFREDEKRVPFKYLKGEMVCSGTVRLENSLVVPLIGYIDRVDEMSGYLRISDYKTGKIDKIEGDILIETLFNPQDDKNLKYLFQLYFYSWMYERQNRVGKEFKFCVYPLRSLSGNSVKERLITMQNLDEFEQRLRLLLEEIFNSEIPFGCKERGGKHCDYCDFHNYCCR